MAAQFSTLCTLDISLSSGAVKCLFLDWCFFFSVGLFCTWHFGTAWSPPTSARLWLAGWDVVVGTCVSARHTSPTFIWRHCSLQVWLVCWGLQEDQPWPQTKKGSPSLTSSDNCRENGNVLRHTSPENHKCVILYSLCPSLFLLHQQPMSLLLNIQIIGQCLHSSLQHASETMNIPQLHLYRFTFMYLADAFVQSDLQCIQAIHLYCQYVCSLGIEPTTFALLTQCSNYWATGTQIF